MRPCCMEVDPEVLGHSAPNPICYLRDTDIVRASERQHPVQRSGSDGNLGGSVSDRAICIGWREATLPAVKPLPEYGAQ
jgi:hypothetical protein